MEFFVRDGRNVVGSLQLKDDFKEEELAPLYIYIKKHLQLKTYSKIKIYFNYFKTTMIQVPLRFKLFPLDKESFDKFLQDIDINLEKIKKPQINALSIEPSKERLIEKLIQESVKYIVYSSVIQNKTGEHASRMLAMKSAKDNS